MLIHICSPQRTWQKKNWLENLSKNTITFAHTNFSIKWVLKWKNTQKKLIKRVFISDVVFLHNAILLCMSGMNKTRWMKVDIKQFLDYVCITNREFFWKDLLLFNKKIYNNSEWNMKHVDFLLLVIPFKKTYKVQRR